MSGLAYLLDEDAVCLYDVVVALQDGTSIVFEACRSGDETAVRLLLASGENVNVARTVGVSYARVPLAPLVLLFTSETVADGLCVLGLCCTM